jgi:hypothetical protein
MATQCWPRIEHSSHNFFEYTFLKPQEKNRKHNFCEGMWQGEGEGKSRADGSRKNRVHSINHCPTPAPVPWAGFPPDELFICIPSAPRNDSHLDLNIVPSFFHLHTEHTLPTEATILR